MQKSISFRLIIAAILLIGITTFTESCRKADKLPVTREQVINTYQEWLTNNGENLATGTIQLNIRADENVKGELAWSSSRIYKSGTDEIMVIPFSFKTASFSKTSRILPALTKGELPVMVDLYLKKDITGKIEGALKISAYKENADKAMRIKYTSAYTLDMKHMVDKQVIGGKIYKLTTMNSSGYLQKTESSNCEEVSYTYSYIQECTGGMDNTACVFKKRTVTRYRCYGTMGGEEEEIDWIDNDDTGGGWSEYDDEEVEYANQAIIDSLQGYPCAQNILAQMPNINAKVSQLLSTFLQADQPVDIRFRINPNLAGTLTSGQTLDIKIINNVVTLIVEINPDILNRGTKEYILLTFMHESIHAYMDYQWRLLQTDKIDTATFISKFPIYWDYRRTLGVGSTELAQHTQMSETYVSFMSNMLSSFNPNISNTTARYLAWEGLRETTLWFNNISDTTAINTRTVIARDTTGNNTHINMYRLSKCP